MKPKLYIETSFVSYLTARPSRDLIVAAVYGLDYLLTWNCKHIANAEIQKNIFRICFKEGYELPIICTPYELMGG